jgi:hypothetical protein
MEDLRFEDIHEEIFRSPTNTRPRGKRAKELGIWLNADISMQSELLQQSW